MAAVARSRHEGSPAVAATMMTRIPREQQQQQYSTTTAMEQQPLHEQEHRMTSRHRSPVVVTSNHLLPATTTRRRLFFSTSSSPPPRKVTREEAEKDPHLLVWTTDRLTPEQIAKVDAIFHKILWLDMFETSMLTELFNERMGLHLTKKQHKQLERQMEARALGKFGAGGKVKDDDDEEETATATTSTPQTVDVKLTGLADPKAKLKVIKEVRSMIPGLGLKEAKEMVESAPVVLFKDLKPETAAEYKEKLEAVGGQLEVVE